MIKRLTKRLQRVLERIRAAVSEDWYYCHRCGEPCKYGSSIDCENCGANRYADDDNDND